ncbi:co-chaperone GrpE [Lachnoanaerobaculum saburreum F0468]|uniref:Protein GrpE n=2 Tax=Lachnoanaerobaculum saburreum TaxID=467210 RepID=I0R9H1_9FIRM|nr:nucleotide exchange factor GrpE [Lachnoanaerobaculum saburreum]EFU78014.1 co-chaperone GrpE [Lachnoanaerobaculum saburreum DSM 3986]EIC96329.1 co-chaperone GrpE [Lachnoanaerobaculum saburreum F0468]RKW40185.1 MAG: nucleotide exchange factor GrpE [Lachnospiraceae bacterium]
MEEKDLKKEQEESKEVLEGEETVQPDLESEETPEEAAAKAAAMEAEVKEAFSDENLEEKQDKKDIAIADLTDRLKRSMAEFDNFRKRSEKEKATMFDMGVGSIAEKILPVVDNFERAMAAAPKEGDGKAFAEGIAMIYNQLKKTLEDLGVKPIDCVGQPFDPNFHNAVMHVEDESLGENVVAEELLKGYMYKDSVLRHSMVKVAN